MITDKLELMTGRDNFYRHDLMQSFWGDDATMDNIDAPSWIPIGSTWTMYHEGSKQLPGYWLECGQQIRNGYFG